MQGRRNPFVAQEGIPLLVLAAVLIWLTWRYLPPIWLPLPSAALLVLYLVFRDPLRAIPSSALGVVSPVDGTVVDISSESGGLIEGGAWRVAIAVDALGTYTARSPVEGWIRDLSSAVRERKLDQATNALWIQTDEGDDIILGFDGYRLGLPPRAIVRYGERLGQGQRCAYLRLARLAVVHLPADAKIDVEIGNELVAGRDLIARLAPP